MSKDQALALLDKYLKGKCSEEEKQRVLSWLEGLDNNSGEWSALSNEARRKYIEQLYIGLQAKMVTGVHEKNGNGRGFWYRMVAAILVLIAASGFLYFITSQSKETTTVKYARISTGIGEMQMVTLKDGTQVWLNAMSEIRYPAQFTGNSREVYIKGEAYFKVAADQDRPFVVHSGLLQTKVLGTSFDIKSYPEDKDIEVAVLSGKVMVRHQGQKDNKVILTQNEKVQYDKKRARLTKSKVANSGDLGAWQRKQLAFYHTPMVEVASVFYRAFGLKMHFADDKVKRYELSGHFDMNQEPENILKAICLSIGGEYMKEGKDVFIKGQRIH